METIEFKLQRCLNNIEDWATENGFKFSKTKTQCVHFCQIRQLHLDPHLTIYGSPIPVVSEAKFLGLLFDNKLSFIPHIKALKAKCLKALDILKVLSISDWGGDRTVLLNLYRSLIRSKLDYGSIVYGSARKSYLKSLDTIHHQGLRLALGAFRTSPVKSLYAESNEPSLYIRREKLSLQYVTKLAANPRNSACDCVFNPKYERFYNNKPTAIKPLGLRIQSLLEEANINIKNVQHFSFPSKEPWTLNPPKIILDLHKNKTEVESHIFKNEFLEIKSNYKHYLSIYTDGSKQDEKVACSVISPNFTDSIRLPDNSSIFTAEAKAIDIALYHIRDQSEKQFIRGWSGGAKVLCILHHWGVRLILAYSWARPAILVVGKGRGGMFLFLLFLHFHSCSSFFPVPLFHLLYSLFYLFSPFLWETTQNDPQGLTCR